MTSNDVIMAVSLAVPMILAAIAGASFMIDAGDCPVRYRWLRLFQSAGCYYFVLLYAGSAYGLLTYYVVRAGIVTRVGISIILIMILIEIVMRRRAKGEYATRDS